MWTERIHLTRHRLGRPGIELGRIVGIHWRVEVGEDAVEIAIGEARECDLDSTTGEVGEDLRQGWLVPLSVGVVVTEGPHPRLIGREVDLKCGNRVPAEFARSAQAHVAREHGPIRQVQERPRPEHLALRNQGMLQRAETLVADGARVLGPLA